MFLPVMDHEGFKERSARYDSREELNRVIKQSFSDKNTVSRGKTVS